MLAPRLLKKLQTWWRRTAAVLVLVVLVFPVVVSAWSLVANRPAEANEEPSATVPVSQDSPFTLDAPTANLNRSNSVSQGVQRIVTAASGDPRKEVVLDDWKYTNHHLDAWKYIHHHHHHKESRHR